MDIYVMGFHAEDGAAGIVTVKAATGSEAKFLARAEITKLGCDARVDDLRVIGVDAADSVAGRKRLAELGHDVGLEAVTFS